MRLSSRSHLRDCHFRRRSAADGRQLLAGSARCDSDRPNKQRPKDRMKEHVERGSYQREVQKRDA
jgi:hypothetical protein